MTYRSALLVSLAVAVSAVQLDDGVGASLELRPCDGNNTLQYFNVDPSSGHIRSASGCCVAFLWNLTLQACDNTDTSAAWAIYRHTGDAAVAIATDYASDFLCWTTPFDGSSATAVTAFGCSQLATDFMFVLDVPFLSAISTFENSNSSSAPSLCLQSAAPAPVESISAGFQMHAKLPASRLWRRVVRTQPNATYIMYLWNEYGPYWTDVFLFAYQSPYGCLDDVWFLINHFPANLRRMPAESAFVSTDHTRDFFDSSPIPASYEQAIRITAPSTTTEDVCMAIYCASSTGCTLTVAFDNAPNVNATIRQLFSPAPSGSRSTSSGLPRSTLGWLVALGVLAGLGMLVKSRPCVARTFFPATRSNQRTMATLAAVPVGTSAGTIAHGLHLRERNQRGGLHLREPAGHAHAAPASGSGRSVDNAPEDEDPPVARALEVQAAVEVDAPRAIARPPPRARLAIPGLPTAPRVPAPPAV